MPLKVKILFLAVFTALIAPYFAFAGEYPIQICPWTKEERAFAPDRCVLDIANCDKGTDKQVVQYDGLVPCGKALATCGTRDKEKCTGDYIMVHCTFCHVFQMVDSVLDYVLGKLVPAVTVLMIVIGGVMLFFGGAKPEMVQKGKNLIKGVLIGIFLIYGAYMIVGEVLALFKFTKNNPLNEVFKEGVFSMQCDIFVPAIEYTGDCK